MIESECAHCGRPLHIDLTDDLQYQVRETDAEPLVFFPLVDFDKLEEPSITHAF